MNREQGLVSSKVPSHNGIRDILASEWLTIVTLVYVNLINYIDRFTVSAVLPLIQKEFKIANDLGGLLQTSFLLSYMVTAPLFGYIGDRYSRKIIIALGVFLWTGASLVASFMHRYWYFLALRAIVGVGEASFSTLAPTIISDIFSDRIRSQMLAAFYIAIPFGCGLGYIVGAQTAKILGHWSWGLRVTPILGALATVMIIFLVSNPHRGASEGSIHKNTSTWMQDLKYLVKNRSFVYSTVATTCYFFVIGALAWWAPTFLSLGLKLQPRIEKNILEGSTFIFGIVTMISGIAGLVLGCYFSQKLKPRFPKVDPFICGLGLLAAGPFLVAASYATYYNTAVCFILLAIGEIFLNINCSVVNDIILYVTLPSRRSSAEGLYLLVGHAFGDAGSPYLVGLLSDFIYSKIGKSAKGWNEFRALQYSLFASCVIAIIGAVFFYMVSLYVLNDKNAVDTALESETN